MLTSVLVRNDLGLVVDEVGDGAVGVAKGDANGSALAGLRASLGPGVTHCCCGFVLRGVRLERLRSVQVSLQV